MCYEIRSKQFFSKCDDLSFLSDFNNILVYLFHRLSSHRGQQELPLPDSVGFFYIIFM